MKRVICFESEGVVHVHRDRLEFLQDGKATFSCPVEDLGLVMLEAVHSRVSVYALQLLADAGVVVVYCDERHMPKGVALPFSGNVLVQSVTSAQLSMSPKVKDRLWQRVVQAKIRNQAEALKRTGTAGWAKLNALARGVLLADRNNREAVAAAEYFRLRGIVRTNSSDEINPMPNPALNYGYAVVRAAMSRALVKSGLLCVCGIHHSNRSNAYALADDMMEPYRPFVDEIVFGLPHTIGKDWVRMSFDSRVKRELLNVVGCEVLIGGMCYPLALSLDRTAQSLADVVLGRGADLQLPEFA